MARVVVVILVAMLTMGLSKCDSEYQECKDRGGSPYARTTYKTDPKTGDKVKHQQWGCRPGSPDDHGDDVQPEEPWEPRGK